MVSIFTPARTINDKQFAELVHQRIKFADQIATQVGDYSEVKKQIDVINEQIALWLEERELTETVVLIKDIPLAAFLVQATDPTFSKIVVRRLRADIC